jgi:HEAT repeat protein
MLSGCLEKLESPDETERSYAAEDIGYLNDANGVEVLLARLAKENSRAVRDAIFQALMRIDADAAIEGSIRLLESDDPQIRNQAVEILQRKGAAAIPFLNTVMREGDNDLRKLVLDIVGCQEANGTAAVFTDTIYEAALADKDINVVITAVENLGRTRATKFRTRIEDLLTAYSHPMLVGACLEALAGTGDESSLAAIRKRFPDLAALPDFFLASWLKVVGAWGSAREFAEVATLLPLRGAHLRAAILGALIAIHERHPAQAEDESLLPALQAVVENGDSPLCRYDAVRALGFLSSRDDVYALLVTCLSSPERLVRLGAIESLRATARPELQQVLASRALAETDEVILQALKGQVAE